MKPPVRSLVNNTAKRVICHLKVISLKDSFLHTNSQIHLRSKVNHGSPTFPPSSINIHKETALHITSFPSHYMNRRSWLIMNLSHYSIQRFSLPLFGHLLNFLTTCNSYRLCHIVAAVFCNTSTEQKVKSAFESYPLIHSNLRALIKPDPV